MSAKDGRNVKTRGWTRKTRREGTKNTLRNRGKHK